MDHLPDLAEYLNHLQDQNPIVLGDLNADIQSQKSRSQQVADLLMEFGLVDHRHHLGSAGGSNIVNVVSDAAWNIFGKRCE